MYEEGEDHLIDEENETIWKRNHNYSLAEGARRMERKFAHGMLTGFLLAHNAPGHIEEALNVLVSIESQDRKDDLYEKLANHIVPMAEYEGSGAAPSEIVETALELIDTPPAEDWKEGAMDGIELSQGSGHFDTRLTDVVKERGWPDDDVIYLSGAQYAGESIKAIAKHLGRDESDVIFQIENMGYKIEDFAVDEVEEKPVKKDEDYIIYNATHKIRPDPNCKDCLGTGEVAAVDFGGNILDFTVVCQTCKNGGKKPIKKDAAYYQAEIDATKPPKKVTGRWKESEIEYLREQWEEGAMPIDIAKGLCRTASSVSCKANGLGLPARKPTNPLEKSTPEVKQTIEEVIDVLEPTKEKPNEGMGSGGKQWTDDERKQLTLMWKDGKDITFISEILGRSEAAVKAQACILQLSGDGKHVIDKEKFRKVKPLENEEDPIVFEGFKYSTVKEVLGTRLKRLQQPGCDPTYQLNGKPATTVDIIKEYHRENGSYRPGMN